MKKIFLLSVLMLTLGSCSIENDIVNNVTVTLPIDSVTIPEEFKFGQVYPIDVTYFRPSSCHLFNTFYIDKNENETTVVLVNTVYEDTNCETFDLNSNETEASFNFQVNNNDTQVFKFWHPNIINAFIKCDDSDVL